jgi:GNAT superfamily N-acetyltransferase
MADVLARAFYDDPPFKWILPTDSTRRRRLRRYFLTEFRHHALRHGGVEIASVGDRIVGVAVWLPPGEWLAPTSGQLLALPGFAWAFGRRLGAASTIVQAAAKAHPRVPHWYLHAIGVCPDSQGRGVGAALLRSRLVRCDSEGSPAYLESSTLTNVPLYEHLGFCSTGTLDLPKDTPVVTAMWRAGTSGVEAPAAGP